MTPYTHRTNVFLRLCALCLPLAAVGCGGGRSVEITARPADATILIDGQPRGRGPVTERFRFTGDVHTASASRPGYKTMTTVVDGRSEKVVIDLKPQSRSVRFAVLPLPGIIKVDGAPVTPREVPQLLYEMSFAVDPNNSGSWLPREVTAERPGYRPAKVDVRFTDSNQLYTLTMQQERKTVTIVTDPPGAEIYLDGDKVGTTPRTLDDLAIPMDPQTNAWETRKVTVSLAGYKSTSIDVSWDGGQSEYRKKLEPLPDSGVASASPQPVSVPQPASVQPPAQPPASQPAPPQPSTPQPSTPPPATPQPTAPQPTAPVASARTGATPRPSKAAAPARPASDGESPAAVRSGGPAGSLASATPATTSPASPGTAPPSPISPAPAAAPAAATPPSSSSSRGTEAVVAVPTLERATLLLPVWTAGETGWSLELRPHPVNAPHETAEPDGRKPALIVPASAATTYDDLTSSPDGARLAWVDYRIDGSKPTSKLMVQRIGTGSPAALTDGSALDVMPSFWPSGQQLVFCSDRAGGKMSLFNIGVVPPDRAEPLEAGATETTDLWPTLDPSARPRVFVESRPALGKGDTAKSRIPSLVMIDVAFARRYPLQDMVFQPRVSPRGDSVVFVRADPTTGKRDIWRLVLAPGQKPVNLTQTPNIDEWDPSWSKTGSRLAFASERLPDKVSAAGLSQRSKLWVMKVVRPEDVIPVTTGPAWDDHPCWTEDDSGLYFRSTRGGSPAVWSIPLP